MKPPAYFVILFLLLAFVASGCGPSAFAAHYRAIGLAAEATGGASEIVYTLSQHEIQTACPIVVSDEQPADEVAFAECAARAVLPLRPAQTVIQALRLALGSWYEATRTAEIAGEDSGDGLRAAARAAAALVRAYGDLTELLRPYEVTLPALPALVVSAADALDME